MKTGRITNIAMITAGVILLLLPFVYESRPLIILLTKIFIFAIFAMSYDILLGFTGIVSFGHAMFFGLGAYSTAIFINRMESSLTWIIISILVALFLSLLLSVIVGLLTLRLKSHFYAMLTLAFASLFLVIAEKWRDLTAGNDGFTFRLPEVLRDRTTFYIVCLLLMLAVFFLLKRITDSPLGKVLMAIRENEQRVESLGFNPLYYKVVATIVAGLTATLAGSLYAMSLRFVNTNVFAIDITLDALLMTIIGGVGTLIGPIVGAGLIEVVHEWLSDLARDFPIFERWMILFGIVYILAVIFFPAGIVGTIRAWVEKRKAKRANRLAINNENKAVQG